MTAVCTRPAPSGSAPWARRPKTAPAHGTAISAARSKKLWDNVAIPNATCFSSDGATAYFTDTRVNKLMKVACDPQTGAPAGEPKVFFDPLGRKGGLDGAVTDADGNRWNARYSAGALDCYAPDGKQVLTIDIPARQTTCPAFVGDGLIAVTSAMAGHD